MIAALRSVGWQLGRSPVLSAFAAAGGTARLPDADSSRPLSDATIPRKSVETGVTGVTVTVTV